VLLLDPIIGRGEPLLKLVFVGLQLQRKLMRRLLRLDGISPSLVQ
jgi:hypothetical protein